MATLNLSSSSSPLLSCPRPSNHFKLFNDFPLVKVNYKSPSTHNAAFKVKSALVSGGGDLLSYQQNNNDIVIGKDLVVGAESILIKEQSNGTLTSDSTFFSADYNDYDLDTPAEGFSSIPEAIEDIRQGKMVVVVDDEDRENEGDLIMAAELATPEAMAFIVKHGTGIVCVSMNEEDLDRLELPLMVDSKANAEKLCTAFTVTVDAKHGTTTGVSAQDRAATVLALASRDSTPADFNRPGHIFPLKYRDGGVLKRAGHTEASADLTILAGLEPVAVLCEIVDDDGSMARLPKLREFAKRENLKIVSIADLIRYRRKRDQLVERSSAARIPTMWGPFTSYCYKSLLDGIEHIAMVKGDIGDGEDVLVRVHSECLTGDIFGSARCDCGNQLALAMQQIEAAGRGVLVYLRGHEGRGIGKHKKFPLSKIQLSQMTSSKPDSCCSCCSGFIITMGLTALFIWLSLRVDEPKLYLDEIYIPALNKTINTTTTNTTFTFMLKLNNPNKDKGIQYDDVHLNFTFFNTLNTTLPLGNATVERFYQGHEKKAKKYGVVVEASVKNLTESVKGVNGKVYVRVDFFTAVKYKILVWYTKRDRLWGGANVEIGNSGQKVSKKSSRLGNEPRVIVSGAWKVCGGYRALMVFLVLFIGLGFT